jgi:hypothetical protein
MGFVIKKNIEFITTARIVTPTTDKNAPLVQEVQVQFRHTEQTADMSNADFLRTAVVQMFELTDEDGNTIEFDDIKDTLLSMPDVQLGLAEAYGKAFIEARVKN